nr:hypothetical protein Clen_382 [Cedratvirus lena]
MLSSKVGYENGWYQTHPHYLFTLLVKKFSQERLVPRCFLVRMLYKNDWYQTHPHYLLTLLVKLVMRAIGTKHAF